MYVYDKVWSNKFNRTMIFSSLMTLWAVFIELFYFFWPKETLQNEFLLNFVYIKTFDVEIVGIIFHTIIWSIAFFFGWLIYTLSKEMSRSRSAGANEYILSAFVVSLFIAFMNESVIIAFLFLVVVAGEYLYMYLSLRD